MQSQFSERQRLKIEEAAMRVPTSFNRFDFKFDGESIRNKRTEPPGCYPNDGVVSAFLDNGGLEIAFSIHYAGENWRVSIPNPHPVRF